jgi:SP family arabinose:H+ symporter-like MFS transporter
MLSPLYIAEVSPAGIRGKMVSVNQLTIVIGILLAYSSNYFLADLENNWRWMFSSGAIPSFFFFICVFMVPESPRWLVSKGKTDNARKILSKITDDSRVKNELKEIEDVVRNEIKGKLSDIFHPAVRFVVVLGVILAVFQQISGANTVFFYAPIIFEKAGMSVRDQLFQQILIGSVNLVFTLIAMQLVDRLGRKKLMLGGSLIMALWLFCIGLCFYLKLFGGYALTFMVLAFIATYATSLAPVTWVLISEIFPIKIRGTAVSLATAMLWVACFALAYGFPVLIKILDAPQTFYLFSGICFTYFLILLRYIPETKGKTLEEFEKELIH